MKNIRIITIPIIVENAKDAKALREIAATAARMANELITARYLVAKKLSPPAVYKDYSDELSSYVRDALFPEVKAVWSKFAKRCLAGHHVLPLFASERALVIRARGVKIIKMGDSFDIRMGLLPKVDWLSWQVYPFRLKKDLYLSGLLERLANKELRIAEGMIVFDRRNPGRIAARIAYEKEIKPENTGTLRARLGPCGDRNHDSNNGELYLRVEGRIVLNLTADVQRIQNMKRNIGGIWQRIRLSKQRKAMRKLQRFEDWALGPLHQMSAAIVNCCKQHHCGEIEWRIVLDGELPWAKLKMLTIYKARELGMEVVEEKRLLENIEKEEVRWARQINKNLREMAQATRKM